MSPAIAGLSRVSLGRRLNYYRRIFGAYLGRRASQLSFWHERPEMEDFVPGILGPYYMKFSEKADYTAHLDSRGIPLLDYLGVIGPQYNPIAVAQYGLGNLNLYLKSGEVSRREKFLRVADWLTEQLEPNQSGLSVWNHHFDFEYRTPLRAPWYSGLAQGQGLSVLVRAHRERGDPRYLEAAKRAFQSMQIDVRQGGVIHTDSCGRRWIEEYIVAPPTHILNGFIWATWGVYDFALATGDSQARQLWQDSITTLKENLRLYDTGYWSLYEQSGTRLKMMASPFYHRLHIVQLRVLAKLCGEPVFQHYADKWSGYQESRIKRTRALAYKSVFKLCYY